MGGLCVLLLMMFCVGWILCVFFLSMLIPLLILYNELSVLYVLFYILYYARNLSLPNIQKVINMYYHPY